MSSCSGCVKRVVRGEPFIECTDCKQTYHATCVNMSSIEIDFLAKNRQSWSCVSCKNNRKGNIHMSIGDELVNLPTKQNTDDVSAIKLSLSRILIEIADMKQTMHKNSVETNTNFTRIDEQITNFVKVFDKIVNFEIIQNQLVDKISNLETRLDELDQKNKNNNLVIHGLKNTAKQMDSSIIKLFNDGLNVNIPPQEIVKCILLNPKSTVSPVLIKFNNRNIIDEILNAKRKNLNKLKELNNGNIFINEDLTEHRRKLMNEARILRKAGKFKFLWTRNGDIMTRRDVGEPVVFVKSMDDLNKIS